MKRRNSILILSMVCLLIFAAAAIALLLKSEGFSRYLIARLSSSASDALTIEKTEGDLLSGLIMHGIDYHVNQNRIFIKKATLAIRPLKLFTGKLHLNRVNMSGIALMLEDDQEHMLSLWPDNSILFNVTADDVRLNGIALRRGGQQYDIEEIHLKGSLDNNVLQVDSLEFMENDVHINAKGNVEFSSPYPFQATIRWVKPLDVHNIRGKCDIHGNVDTLKFNHQLFEPRNIRLGGEVSLNRLSPDGYQIAFKGDLDGVNLPPADIELNGEGRLQKFGLKKFTIKSLGGEIRAVGDVSWQPSPQWALNIEGEDIDTGKNWALWPGELDFEVSTRGKIAEDVLTLELNEIAVVGSLLNQPFNASGDVRINDEHVTIANLNMRSGNNHASLDGIASKRSNLRFEMNLTETENLWPGIYGHVRGNGLIKGDYRKPVGTITFDGTDMKYGNYNLQKIESTIKIDLKNSTQSRGQAQLYDLRVSDKHFASLSLKWSGDFKAHQAHVNIGSPETSMGLDFNGSSVKDNCELNINNASFSLEKHGRWQLLNPTRLQISPHAIKPFDTCWVQDQSEICLRSSWKDTNGWNAQGDTDAPALVAILEILKDVLDKKHLGWDKAAGH